MLPILPALLLLLLSGASKMDRAVSACLPGGLEALHRASASKPTGDATKAEHLWASLLALKVGPEEMDRAFAVLMSIDIAEPVPRLVPIAVEPSLSPPRDLSRPMSPEGWSSSSRTRDGPGTR